MSDDDDKDDAEAHARSTDPDTSHEAAEKVNANRLEKMYLAALQGGQSLTTTEIANYYNMDRDSFSPRSRPLIRKKLIVEDGKRACVNSGGKVTKMLAFRLRTD